jgi:hypothetical protein
MNQSHWNVNWNCISLLQNNKPSFNLITAKMAKKVWKTEKNCLILLSSRGITPAKMNQSNWNTNWNCNSLLQSNKPSLNAVAAKIAKKKSGKLKWRTTDGQRYNIIRPVLRMESAFEHHCAWCYNLPFTGFKLIHLVQTYCASTTIYYPIRKKVCEFEIWESFRGTIFCGGRFL